MSRQSSENDPFTVYSWKTWFKSLTLPQLYNLRDKWYQAAVRSQLHHERRVLAWDLIEVTKEIMQREGKDTFAAAPTNQDT